MRSGDVASPWRGIKDNEDDDNDDDDVDDKNNNDNDVEVDVVKDIAFLLAGDK